MKEFFKDMAFWAFVAVIMVGLSLAGDVFKAYASEKKDELRYEVNVTIRFNSLNVSELAEVQKILDGLAAKLCKTEINLEKLPKDNTITFENITGSTN